MIDFLLNSVTYHLCSMYWNFTRLSEMMVAAGLAATGRTAAPAGLVDLGNHGPGNIAAQEEERPDTWWLILILNGTC